MNINWKFVLTAIPLFERAAWLTLELALRGIESSLGIGLMCG